MEKRLVLSKRPKNPIIIEGFPGFGLVGTIATGFLADHLKCEKIGTAVFDNVAPTVAIHDCKSIAPITIFYNKRYNVIIINSIVPPTGIEWKAAEIVQDVADQLGAKEIITMEGVGSAETSAESRGFHFTHDAKASAKMKSIGVPCLGEGIIVGVTAALLLTTKTPLTCVFAETHSQLPDSKAAAKMVEILDKYLGLDVDYRPLLKQAEVFEQKIRGILEQASKSKTLQSKKETSYIS